MTDNEIPCTHPGHPWRCARVAEDSWHDAGRAAYWDYERLAEATTALQFADAVTRLSNSMADLVTWIPGFDIETGILHDPSDDE